MPDPAGAFSDTLGGVVVAIRNGRRAVGGPASSNRVRGPAVRDGMYAKARTRRRVRDHRDAPAQRRMARGTSRRRVADHARGGAVRAGRLLERAHRRVPGSDGLPVRRPRGPAGRDGASEGGRLLLVGYRSDGIEHSRSPRPGGTNRRGVSGSCRRCPAGGPAASGACAGGPPGRRLGECRARTLVRKYGSTGRTAPGAVSGAPPTPFGQRGEGVQGVAGAGGNCRTLPRRRRGRRRSPCVRSAAGRWRRTPAARRPGRAVRCCSWRR